MSDIFLSYAADDKDRIKPLVEVLAAAGVWSIFLDSAIRVGANYYDVLEKELAQAGCVVVVWSKNSKRSHFVWEECDHARRRNVLVPVRIDDIEPPYGFRSIETANLVDWNGDIINPSFQHLLVSITSILNQAGGPLGEQIPYNRPDPSHSDNESAPVQQERELYPGKHDNLTGLVNRPVFLDRLHQTTIRAKRSGGRFALMFMDLDRFKSVNDEVGHDGGDQLLKVVAGHLKDSVRETDTVARLQGDEFTVLLDDVAQLQDVARIAQDIVEKIERPLDVNGHRVSVGASIGIAIYPKDGEEPEALLKAADLAVYHAKDQGRGNYQFYSSDLKASAIQRLGWEQDLRRALKEEEFLLHYQPQIDITSNKVFGIEALLRWNHIVRGLVMPDKFIQFLEDKKLIVQVGEWILASACRQLKLWQNGGTPRLRLAVNLSAIQIMQPNFVKTVESVLNEAELDPATLELELTVAEISPDTFSTLQKLRDKGITITLDGFASSFPLSVLTEMPVDAVKIERATVETINVDPRTRAITKAVIDLAGELDIDVVAEGVETEATLQLLRELGCTRVQGYLFCKPLPADELSLWLRSHI